MSRQHQGHEQPAWVFDTRELARRPGSSMRLRRTIGAPADLGSDVIAVPEGEPVDVELTLESVVEGIWVSGTVTTHANGACVRCLEPVRLEIEADVQELFAYPDRAEHHRKVAGADADEDDVRELDGDDLDFEPALRDTVVPALPFQPVCREDCPGLCSECGVLLAQDPGHHHEVLDPRWAALSGLVGSDASTTSTMTNDHSHEKRN